MYKLEEYKSIADEMIANDSERDKKFTKIDEMHNVDWDIPSEWKETNWIRKYASTKPADALDTAIRSLSTKEPRLSIMPLLPNAATRSNFDIIERGLMWAWKQIGRRSQSNPTRAIVASAIKYDEITAQLVHIPTHNKSLEALGKSANLKGGLGDFSLIVHNPRNVHVQYSDIGFERVVLCKQQPYHKVIDFWGKNAEALKKQITADDATALTDLVDVYDYMDDTVRAVWVGDMEYVLMEPTEHKLGFIPWACRVGGSNLEDYTENQRRPMLNSLVSGDQWHTINLFRSLMLSLIMARAASPDLLSVTPTGDGVDVDATEPIGQIRARPGESVQRLPPSEVGQGIQNLYQMLGGEMEQSAGINLLQMNSAPAGMAFATFNAMMQAAMASINPHKQTAELAMSDIFGLMVAWIKYSGDDLVSYDDRQKNVVDNISSYGTQEVITADMLPDLQDFCATVKLTEYVPSDEMGKINSMTMLTQMGYPVERAFEGLDVSDPKQAMEEWANEQKTKASVMEEVKDIQFEAEMLRQRRQFEMQQKMQEQQMQAQAQAQQGGAIPPGQPGSQEGIMPEDQAMQAPFENASGQGFAGNFGGSSPLAAAPNMTGMGLPAMEGRDNRGLRLPPEGRAPIE